MTESIVMKFGRSQEDYVNYAPPKGGSFLALQMIKTIYRISKRNSGGWVSNSEIANELGVSPSSVSEMLHTLKDFKVIKWVPRKSIRLTDKGLIIAKKLNDRYKLLVAFFKDIFQVDNEQIIQEFCYEIEHKIPKKIYKEIVRLYSTTKGKSDSFTQDILSVSRRQ
jgi:DtxR family Mn-dependent transcriptional regulator